MAFGSIIKLGKKVAKKAPKKAVGKAKAKKGGPVKAGRTERAVFGTDSSANRKGKKKPTSRTPKKASPKRTKQNFGADAALIVTGEASRNRKKLRKKK